MPRKAPIKKALSLRLLFLTTLIVCLMNVAVMLVVAHIYEDRIHQDYKRRALTAIKVLAGLLDGETVDGYLNRLEEDEGYRNIRKQMRILLEGHDLTYFYVLRVVEGGSVYVFDATKKDSSGLGDFYSWLDEWGEGHDAEYEALLAGGRIKPTTSHSPVWGTLLTFYEPIPRADGSTAAYAGVDISVENILEERNHVLVGIGLAIPFLILVLSGIYYLAVNRLVITPASMMAGDAFLDHLTGLPNRRFFDDHVKNIMQTLSRSVSPLTLMMIDIDHFKHYNDTYGHAQGDICLREIAASLLEAIDRSDDLVARYGGEEFVAVLPNTNEDGARHMAAKLLKSVQSRVILHEGIGQTGCVTISIGSITGKVTHPREISDYVQRSDQLLYQSKRNGRNRATFGSLSQTSE